MTGASLLLARRFDASAATVFRAWVDPHRMAQWLLPRDVHQVASVHSDACAGGRFRLEGRRDDGRLFAVSGRYLEFVEPTSLVMSWRYQGPDHDLRGANFAVRVALRAVAPGTTELMLTHELLRDRSIGEARTRADRVAARDGRSGRSTDRIAHRVGGATPRVRSALPRRTDRPS